VNIRNFRIALYLILKTLKSNISVRGK